MKRRIVLTATLGGQPQITTFALDILLQRGEDIDKVAAVARRILHAFQVRVRDIAVLQASAQVRALHYC